MLYSDHNRRLVLWSIPKRTVAVRAQRMFSCKDQVIDAALLRAGLAFDMWVFQH